MLYESYTYSSDNFSESKTFGKILSFAKLKHGWHYGVGGPLKSSVISAALGAHWRLLLNGFDDTNAFPGANGELMVTAYHASQYLEIVVEHDCTLHVCYEIDGSEVMSKSGMTYDEAIELLDGIAPSTGTDDQCVILGSYIQSTLTRTQAKIVSNPWHLETIQPGERLLSNESAWTTAELQYAITQEDIIATPSLVSPQYFGNLTDQFCQMEAA
ncbi:MAG: hypothetical protein H6870_14295 [Methylobacteriaceae bacterium]|nr:hypothetical protein [Methylobacteriaceae bacterium]